MTQSGQLNSMRSKLAQLQVKRLRSAWSAQSVQSTLRNKNLSFKSYLDRSKFLDELSETRVAQLFKVETRPLSAQTDNMIQQEMGLTKSTPTSKSGGAVGKMRKTLFTAFDYEQTLILPPEKGRLSLRLKCNFRSQAVKNKFAPEGKNFLATSRIANDLTEKMRYVSAVKAPVIVNPIVFSGKDIKDQQKIVSNSQRYFDIVDNVVNTVKETGLKWGEKRPKKAMRRRRSWLDRLTTVVIGSALFLIGIYFGPTLMFDVLKLNASERQVEQLSTELSHDVDENSEQLMSTNAVEFLGQDLPPATEEKRELEEADKKEEAVLKQPTLPQLDQSLPEGEWLEIKKIGLKGLVRDDSNLEQALAEGIVRVSGYGEVGINNGQPVILAAHRFGYKWWWKSDYAKNNSFYYLPDLVVGDTVSIVKDQRRWYYEIYDSYEGTAIDSYQADLILYTCRYLNSDVRYFKYARLIDPALYKEKGLI